MRNSLIIAGIILGSLTVAIFVIGFVFWFAFGGGVLFLPNPPKPEIIYGEFPFRLTYELDGEIKVIEDVIICEFDGFEIVGESGKYRKWKERLKGGDEWLTLLDLRPLEETNEFGQTMLELYFFYGTAAYYMGDELNPYARSGQTLDYISYSYQTTEGIIGGSSYEANQAWEKYRIKLISWEPSPPIQNSFK